MKRIFMFIMVTLVTIKSFGQQIDTVFRMQAESLLLKSKKQKSGGLALLVGGGLLVGAGLLIGNRRESTFGEAGTGVILGGLGVLSAIGSIPLFIASGRKRRNAQTMVALDMQQFRFHYRPGMEPGFSPVAQLTVTWKF